MSPAVDPPAEVCVPAPDEDDEDEVVESTPAVTQTKTVEKNVVKVMIDLSDSGKDAMLTDRDFDTFGLADGLVSATSSAGFTSASRVQDKCIPIIIGREDLKKDPIPVTKRPNIIAQAPSGQGKTATFVLGALQTILDGGCDADGRIKSVPLVVMVSNTNSLARQTRMVMQSFIADAELDKKGMNPAVRVVSDKRDDFTEDSIDKYDRLYPNKTRIEQVCEPGQCPQVISGTPHQIEKVAQMHHDSIMLVIFDEADVIISQENEKGGKGGKGRSHEDLCRIIVQKCKKAQIALFSATYGKHAVRVASQLAKARGGRNTTHEVLLATSEQSVESIVQCCLRLENNLDHKMTLLYQLIQAVDLGQIVVFVNSKKNITQIKSFFHNKGLTVDEYHAGIKEDQRVRIEEQFTKGHLKVLVMTDILARGWNPSGVGLVVQFDLPDQRNGPIDTYQHRIGRTGRAGKDGVSLCFVTRQEEKLLNSIKQTYNRPIKELTPESFTADIRAEVEKIASRRVAEEKMTHSIA